MNNWLMWTNNVEKVVLTSLLNMFISVFGGRRQESSLRPRGSPWRRRHLLASSVTTLVSLKCQNSPSKTHQGPNSLSVVTSRPWTSVHGRRLSIRNRQRSGPSKDRSPFLTWQSQNMTKTCIMIWVWVLACFAVSNEKCSLVEFNLHFKLQKCQGNSFDVRFLWLTAGK